MMAEGQGVADRLRVVALTIEIGDGQRIGGEPISVKGQVDRGVANRHGDIRYVILAAVAVEQYGQAQ